VTTNTDITNDALQLLGTRTTVASLSEQSNEAIQANLIITKLRDQLLRMAPWSCSFNFANLTVITAAPGTPENTSTAATTWAKGIPPPPWAYEYQYPADCLRAQVIIPQYATGFASGIPITTAVTGGAPTWWSGPPAKFKVAIDQFYAATAATVAAGGAGYVAGDRITLAGTVQGSAPIGAPAVLQVATIGGGGAVATVTPISNVIDETLSGSYFLPPTSPVAQGSTTGVGAGATFNLTTAGPGDQRVILTNQEFAILGYCRQVTDPNVMDPLFQNAWTHILASRLAMVLTGDKATANMQIQLANSMIIEARKADGNEGLTINDYTPDWIRFRGIAFDNWEWSPNQGWDWGGVWPTYA
jgi:hypothetical protein